MTRDPVKCPDCQTWWRGDEHRCDAPDWFKKVLEAIEAMPRTYLPCALPHYLTNTWPTRPYPWDTTITYGTITTGNTVTDTTMGAAPVSNNVLYTVGGGS